MAVGLLHPAVGHGGVPAVLAVDIGVAPSVAEGRHLPLEFLGVPSVVGVHERHEFAVSCLRAPVACGAHAASLVAAVVRTRIVVASDHLRSAVVGPPVDNDEFEVRVRLREDALYRLAHRVRAFVRREDDADGHRSNR